MAQLLIYCPELTARCRYIFQTVFEEFSGVPYELTTDTAYFISQEKPRINYSNQQLNNTFHIRPQTLLFEQGVHAINPQVSKVDDMNLLFTTENADLPFDIFAAIFFMISRYEEYLPFEPDEHGRFPARHSLAFRQEFLNKPIVNYWLAYFQKRLKARYPGLAFRTQKFQPILTYDIDIALAYKGRPIMRLLAAALQDLIKGDFNNLRSRFSVINNSSKDPFDTYDIIKFISSDLGIPVICFFLLGDYAKHDKNIPYYKKDLGEIILQLNNKAAWGIHPSYASNEKAEKVFSEKKRLEKLSGQTIIKSRQHYLKLRFPETYRQLIAAGIKEDYSLVFADRPGFRAGCCFPFYFYDITKEATTNLKIFPCAYMDGTFKDEMHLDPDESLTPISALIKEVRKFNGTFISIWHNSSISDAFDWKGWKKVHDKMLEELIEDQ